MKYKNDYQRDLHIFCQGVHPGQFSNHLDICFALRRKKSFSTTEILLEAKMIRLFLIVCLMICAMMPVVALTNNDEVKYEILCNWIRTILLSVDLQDRAMIFRKCLFDDIHNQQQQQQQCYNATVVLSITMFIFFTGTIYSFSRRLITSQT